MSPQFFPIDFLIKLTRVLIKSIIEAVEHSNKDQKQEDLWTPETQQLSMRKINPLDIQVRISIDGNMQAKHLICNSF